MKTLCLKVMHKYFGISGTFLRKRCESLKICGGGNTGPNQQKNCQNLHETRTRLLPVETSLNDIHLMAFPLSNNQRDIANRKLLEDLHLKKQILLKQGTASTLNPTALPLLGSAIQLHSNETQPLNYPHQKALLQANAQSTGYFISQDSSFGNLILPVLPRFDNNKPA